MVSGVLALFVIATLADVVGAGPLDPPGPLGSTQQRIADIPPSWHQILASNNGDGSGCNSTRFECVMGGVAVLDHETGLVWQRAVSGDLSGLGEFNLCETMELGGRYGWRLPSSAELRSLLDGSADHLPDGHPFTGVSPGTTKFWTSSFFPQSTGLVALVVDLSTPGTQFDSDGSPSNRRWCVRSGEGWDLRL